MAKSNVIGARIKKMREEKNISREELAKKAGITVSSVTMYELGERIPRDAVKVKIAETLGESVEMIFFTL